MKKTLLLLFCLALTLSACGQPAMTAGEEVSPAVDVTTPSVPGAFEEPLPSFPPAGEMLEVDCGEYAPLEDDGSRRERILALREENAVNFGRAGEAVADEILRIEAAVSGASGDSKASGAVPAAAREMRHA